MRVARRCSLPPCGGGSGWGVGRCGRGGAPFNDSHPRPLPTRGRGEEAPPCRVRDATTFAALTLTGGGRAFLMPSGPLNFATWEPLRQEIEWTSDERLGRLGEYCRGVVSKP